ncbi:hypothetical protein [Cryobacterium arcticum]|nr:hypothetical protein [Cryobacterium arcticum]
MTVTERRQCGPRPQTLARRKEILQAAVENLGSKGYTAPKPSVLATEAP